MIGFAVEAKARTLIENCEAVAGIPATYVQATPDLIMTDLLKNMRSSQIFSICGLPEIKLRRIQTEEASNIRSRLLGLDTFDPVNMDPHHLSGNDVPAWFLDCDYNDLCFHVSQAFFPRTSAWDNLKKALRATHQETVWDHLAGDTSAPFDAGERHQIAVKVIDDRGNELLVVKKLIVRPRHERAGASAIFFRSRRADPQLTLSGAARVLVHSRRRISPNGVRDGGAPLSSRRARRKQNGISPTERC